MERDSNDADRSSAPHEHTFFLPAPVPVRGGCAEGYAHFLRLWAFLILCIAPLAGCGGGSDASEEAPEVLVRQSAVAAADFNRDGRLDLAVSSAFFSGDTSFTGEVEVLQQSQSFPGTFPTSQRYEVGFDPAHVVAIDLNGDLYPDLVTANETSDSVSVLLNQPGNPGVFFPAVDYSCGPQPLSVAVGNFNGDAFPDLAVAVADGVDILLQDPNNPGRFLSPSTLLYPGGTFSVAVGDLDGLGLSDIAASGTDKVVVFFQSTPGSFPQRATFDAGVQPNGIAVGDIDLDRERLDDIVVANIGSSVDGTNSTVSVLLQDPVVPGRFNLVSSIAAPNGTRSVALGNLDADVYPDLAVASTVIDSPNPGLVSVFFQNATAPGTFSFSASYPDGFTPESVVVGDFNGDLRRDIAVQDGPSIFFNTTQGAPGTFLPEVVVGP